MSETLTNLETKRLFDNNNARFFYNLNLRGYQSKNWELIRVIPTAKNPEIRAVQYMWEYKKNPDIVMNIEVLECSSIRNARGFAKGLRSRNHSSADLVNPTEQEESEMPLIHGAEYAVVNVKDGVFYEAQFSRFNLAFEIQQASGPSVLHDEIGDLEPLSIFNSAISNPGTGQFPGTLKVSKTSVKAGERLEFELNYDKKLLRNWWFLILSDTEHASIYRKGEKFYFHPGEDHPTGEVSLMLLGFDAEFKRHIYGPVFVNVE